MWILINIAETVALIVGSILAATLLCCLLWRWFRRLPHPDWAAVAVWPAALLILHEIPTDSVFLRMTLAFTLVGAISLWIEGRALKQSYTNPVVRAAPRLTRGVPTDLSKKPRRYPIIVACIGEARQPRQDEVRTVAARIWREGLQQNLASENAARSFVTRRRALRLASAALSGRVNDDGLRKGPDNDT